MKKYSLILLLFSLLACNLVFHEDDAEFEAIDNEEELNQLINGVYVLLANVHNEDYYHIMSRSDDINDYTNYSAGGSGSSCAAVIGPIDYPLFTGYVYVNLYNAIVNINNILCKLSEDEYPVVFGELYFLRAYCYLKLVRLFATPPIVLDTEVNYLLEKPSSAEVYLQIEQDLLAAISLLTESYSEARIPGESPNKGTAKAMLAEVYLNMAGYPVNDEQKYADAAQLAGEVITNAADYNFQLSEDFADLWKEDPTLNKEWIFGLRFNTEETNWQNHYNGSSPEFAFFDAAPKNYRFYNSFVVGYYRSIDIELLDTTLQSLQFFPYNAKVNPCPYIHGCKSLKWYGEVSDLNSIVVNLKRSSQVPLYILRYAQTLLTYAEAKVRSGQIDESVYETINLIRRRANHVDLNQPSLYDLTPNLNTAQLLDSIVWERAWELCSEPDGRWFDIVRLQLFDEVEARHYKADNHTVVPEKYLSEDGYFYLLPQEDRWANPNLEQ